jgi:hypothetical protein
VGQRSIPSEVIRERKARVRQLPWVNCKRKDKHKYDAAPNVNESRQQRRCIVSTGDQGFEDISGDLSKGETASYEEHTGSPT